MEELFSVPHLKCNILLFDGGEGKRKGFKIL
jgi:hypothetical protein